MLEKWKQTSSHVCCQNTWIRVREDAVLLPTGVTLGSFLVIEYPGAVGILFVDEHKLLMVRQFRYPLKKFTWEIPAGALLKSESVMESAARELHEETGYMSETITPLCKFHPSPGSSNEVIHLVLASGIKQVDALPDVKLFEVSWVPLGEVIDRILQGEITHSPTIVGLFVALQRDLIAD